MLVILLLSRKCPLISLTFSVPYEFNPSFASARPVPALTIIILGHNEQFDLISAFENFTENTYANIFVYFFSVPYEFNSSFASAMSFFCKTSASPCQFPFIWNGKEYK